MTGYPEGALITRMGLVYGKVPKGYVQTVPSNGTVVPLSAGQIYYFVAETTGAPGTFGFFYMDKTGPIRTGVPGLCASGWVGEVKALKCGTTEPFVEPKDLEQFVRENRN
jgi:hypothetical protein